MRSLRFLVVVCVLVGPGSLLDVHAQTPTGVSAEQATPIWLQMEKRLDAGDYVDIRAQRCGATPAPKAVRYDTPTVLLFKNTTGREVKYYWLDYEGKRSQERTLKPGESQYVRTYLTHPFEVVDASGACSAVYLPQAQPGVITLAERQQ